MIKLKNIKHTRLDVLKINYKNKPMKKLLLSFFLLFLINCSSDNTQSEPTEADDFIPPYVVKYEIVFPNVATDRNTTVICSYEENAIWRINGAPGTSFYLGNSPQYFTKTFTVTTNRNPLELNLITNFDPTTTSNITLRLFVNNILIKEINQVRQPYTGVNTFSGLDYFLY